MVVASVRGAERLEACLQSVAPEAARHEAEIVVSHCGGPRLEQALSPHWPSVVFVPVDGPPGVPRARGIGLARSGGARVALTEDHCLVREGWLAGLLAAPGSAAVVGGPVDTTQRRRGIDLGAWFAEYGLVAPGAGTDPTLITGANVLYGPGVVDEVAEWMSEGAWENVVHDRLRSRGEQVIRIESAVVAQDLTYGVLPFARDRFDHGRSYARARLREAGGSRVLRALMALVLPALLLGRVARRGGRGAPRDFLRALPWTTLFLSAWSAGEFAGYATAGHRARAE